MHFIGLCCVVPGDELIAVADEPVEHANWEASPNQTWQLAMRNQQMTWMILTHTQTHLNGIISAPPGLLPLRICTSKYGKTKPLSSFFFVSYICCVRSMIRAPDFQCISGQDLVQKLSKRPVVGKFRRGAQGPRDSAGATTKLWSSVNSMGAQLLTAARGGEQGRKDYERSYIIIYYHII